MILYNEHVESVTIVAHVTEHLTGNIHSALSIFITGDAVMII